jgi:aminoglycoside/choline kinase family phosphotransferase
MSNQLSKLHQWLQVQIGTEVFQLMPLTNDASFRRYFRLTVNDTSYVVMEAPPEKENCVPFIDIAQRLQSSGLNVPQIIASDLTSGFLLLSDLGDELYLPALTPKQADSLYADAITALITMQTRTSTQGLPLYDSQRLHQEMNLFIDWLLKTHLNLSLSVEEDNEFKACFAYLTEQALSQPQIFVHRDYHSRNLMVVPTNNPGILDFQDAVQGPITYDLVSLLRDCYISWSSQHVMTWVKQYYSQAQVAGIIKVTEIDLATFLKWFDLMGIQRHLKASGIFARLYRRDGKPGYLKDIPRTLNYIVENSGHDPKLAFLQEWLSQRVLPACQAMETNRC